MYADPVDLAFGRRSDGLAAYPICFGGWSVDMFVDLVGLDASEFPVVVEDTPSLIAGEWQGGVGLWKILGVSAVCFGGGIHLIVAFYPPVHDMAILIGVSCDVSWGPCHERGLELVRMQLRRLYCDWDGFR
jgi:hypothetical protein